MTRDHNQHVLDTVFNQGPAVLITGALTGIGRATALAFAREGARIVVSGGHDEKGNALVAELQAIGAEAAFIKSDDRHDDEVRALVDETVKQLGRLDVAVIMLPASMRWKVLPRQHLLSLPRPGCASMSSLRERSRPAC